MITVITFIKAENCLFPINKSQNKIMQAHGPALLRNGLVVYSMGLYPALYYYRTFYNLEILVKKLLPQTCPTNCEPFPSHVSVSFHFVQLRHSNAWCSIERQNYCGAVLGPLKPQTQTGITFLTNYSIVKGAKLDLASHILFGYHFSSYTHKIPIILVRQVESLLHTSTTRSYLKWHCISHKCRHY